MFLANLALTFLTLKIMKMNGLRSKISIEACLERGGDGLNSDILDPTAVKNPTDPMQRNLFGALVMVFTSPRMGTVTSPAPFARWRTA
jgi:hypothetical protein